MSVHGTHAHAEKMDFDMTDYNTAREPLTQQHGGVLLAAGVQEMKEDMRFLREELLDFPSDVVVVEDANSDDHTSATAYEVYVCDDRKRDKQE